VLACTLTEQAGQPLQGGWGLACLLSICLLTWARRVSFSGGKELRRCLAARIFSQVHHKEVAAALLVLDADPVASAKIWHPHSDTVTQ